MARRGGGGHPRLRPGGGGSSDQPRGRALTAVVPPGAVAVPAASAAFATGARPAVENAVTTAAAAIAQNERALPMSPVPPAAPRRRPTRGHYAPSWRSSTAK